MQYGYEAIYNLLTFSGFADLPKVNSAVIFFYFCLGENVVGGMLMITFCHFYIYVNIAE